MRSLHFTEPKSCRPKIQCVPAVPGAYSDVTWPLSHSEMIAGEVRIGREELNGDGGPSFREYLEPPDGEDNEGCGYTVNFRLLLDKRGESSAGDHAPSEGEDNEGCGFTMDFSLLLDKRGVSAVGDDESEIVFIEMDSPTAEADGLDQALPWEISEERSFSLKFQELIELRKGDALSFGMPESGETGPGHTASSRPLLQGGRGQLNTASALARGRGLVKNAVVLFRGAILSALQRKRRGHGNKLTVTAQA